ncbi:MAG: LytTR family DNA-binding domain-containing protein [Lachnospiraceae bacterium]|nr:LytTR family DNA-binding domain-containing protein [Lachnospiraceae bacterium]
MIHRKKGCALNIAIVENEPDYRRQLCGLCSEYGESRHVRLTVESFPSAEAFLASFSEGRDSLVFIDIYMEEMSGVELAREIRQTDPHTLLVFCTSSPDFMPEAFSLHAFEYVTKPYTLERIFQILEDAQRIAAPASRYIRISSGRQTFQVLLDDIVSVVTAGHYLLIGLQDGTVHKTRLTAPAFLDLVEHDDRFLTINKGVIVNADHVDSVGTDCCVMENGSTFPIRVRDRQQIQQRLQDHIFQQIRRAQRHS